MPIEGDARYVRDYVPSAMLSWGGVLMCAGPDCVGTFTLCTFEQCTLYVVAGARVRFSRCHFHHSVPAVVASGAATVACFSSCLFDSCQVSMIAVKGPGVSMHAPHDVSLHASDVIDSSAAVVTDAGSHAELAQSTHLMSSTAALPLSPTPVATLSWHRARI
eukprot:jgi/Ulvmu1/1021/UM104_0006.1